MAVTQALQIENLSYSYPASRKGEPDRKVLSNLNLSIMTGEIFGLLGPNGGGKTTLFKILSTLLLASDGKVNIFDVDVRKEPAEARRKIGVIFQNPSLDKKLTVEENIIHQGHLYGLRGALLEERKKDVLARLGLESRSQDRVEILSGGFQRRCEIAKGLLHQPEILIMDEPSTGLDPRARRDMWDTLFDLKKKGMTILLTTHLMEEGDKCDRVAILHRGECVTVGTPMELKNTIGGNILTIQTSDSSSLAKQIKARWNFQPQVLGNSLRIETQKGETLIPELMTIFPDFISEISIGKPTLEDVFVSKTGEQFSLEGQE